MHVPPFEFAIRKEEEIAVGFSTSIPSSIIDPLPLEGSTSMALGLGVSLGVERRIYDHDRIGGT